MGILRINNANKFDNLEKKNLLNYTANKDNSRRDSVKNLISIENKWVMKSYYQKTPGLNGFTDVFYETLNECSVHKLCRQYKRREILSTHSMRIPSSNTKISQTYYK